MIRSIHIGLIAFLLIGLASCKKDELVLTDLTTNPFDADYDGAAIFTVVSSSTSFVSVNGALVRQLKVTVQVRTELFGRPTPYIVRVEERFDGNSSASAPSSSTNDRFDILTNDVITGQEYCWKISLGNAGNYGGSNELCATAD